MKTLGDPADVELHPRQSRRLCARRDGGSLAPSRRGRRAIAAPASSRFPYLRVRGEIALIGLNSGVPTAPLMASGRLGRSATRCAGPDAGGDGRRGLARVILIHHPPLSRGGSPPLRGLDDAREFERTIADYGAEAILHGHTHKRMVHYLPSSATRREGGLVPVIGAPSASAATRRSAPARRLLPDTDRALGSALAGRRAGAWAAVRKLRDRRA